MYRVLVAIRCRQGRDTLVPTERLNFIDGKVRALRVIAQVCYNIPDMHEILREGFIVH